MEVGLLSKVIQTLTDDNNLNILHQYMKSNRCAYIDSTDKTSDNSHKQYEIYTRYTAIIDDIITTACSDNKIQPMVLYELCRNRDDLPVIQAFSQVFLKASAFDVFREMIISDEKIEYLFYMLKGYRNSIQ